jgi:hypothetical protein
VLTEAAPGEALIPQFYSDNRVACTSVVVILLLFPLRRKCWVGHSNKGVDGKTRRLGFTVRAWLVWVLRWPEAFLAFC